MKTNTNDIKTKYALRKYKERENQIFKSNIQPELTNKVSSETVTNRDRNIKLI